MYFAQFKRGTYTCGIRTANCHLYHNTKIIGLLAIEGEAANLRDATVSSTVGMFGDFTEMIELTKETESRLPPPGMNVIVQCDGFRCLAYRAEDGTWKTTYGDQELKGVRRFSSD